MFSDIDRRNRNYEAIMFVGENLLMSGYFDASFKPDKEVTFAELCKILYSFVDNGNCNSYVIRKEDTTYHAHWAKEYMAYVIVELCGDEDLKWENHPKPDDFIEVKYAYDLFCKTKSEMHQLIIPPVSEISMGLHSRHITRAWVAALLYEICKLTGVHLTEMIRQYNNTDTSKSIKLLADYRLCISAADSDFRIINAHLISITVTDKATYYKRMLKILGIRKKFFQRTKNEIIYHYTTTTALEALTRPGARFRLSNATYLNDPQEGELLIDIVKKRDGGHRNTKVEIST